MIKLTYVFSVLTLVVLSGPSTHAAYGGGGGGGGGGGSFVTNSVLKKDVCKYGDSSGSYFDGTCEKKDAFHESATETKQDTVKDIQKELKKLITTLSKNKVLVNKDTSNKKPTKKYLKAQIKIDSIMNRRDRLAKNDKELKLFTLLQITESLSKNKKITGDLLMIISYVHQKSLLMAKNSIGVQ